MKIFNHCSNQLILCAAFLFPFGPTHAETFYVLPTVTVTEDAYTDFSGWGGYQPWYNSTQYLNNMIVGDQFFAQLNSMTAVMKSTSVCLAPVSADAKSTTSESDVTSRWLAAQEVFNSTKNMNLLTKYFAIMKDLTFVIDGNSYKGFTVGYADGTGETWAINPAYATSTIKLLDHPMPGSLSPYQGKSHRPKCNAG